MARESIIRSGIVTGAMPASYICYVLRPKNIHSWTFLNGIGPLFTGYAAQATRVTVTVAINAIDEAQQVGKALSIYRVTMSTIQHLMCTVEVVQQKSTTSAETLICFRRQDSLLNESHTTFVALHNRWLICNSRGWQHRQLGSTCEFQLVRCHCCAAMLWTCG